MSSIVEALPATLMRNSFIRALERGVTSVHIVATSGMAGKQGAICVAVQPVSTSPALLMVSLHQANPLCDAINKNRLFSVNTLSEQQKSLVKTFSSDSEGDRFDPAIWTEERPGAPRLDAAIASIECALHSQFEAGTQQLFIGEALNVHIHPGMPLAWQARQFVLLQRDLPA
ncbi:flavin reductase family protein [Pantoea sp. LMR881]|uniref:flavin reductase family protein n=1 Tax=Pantoea sp. LMR881 TaxID=3014336 RepID=UPI0022AF2BE6|nr:flavin reductase family protein [Pantoea sp. LMR881]MCZ4057998.1 flavin reductase family protein [Pantoea sp. LMR881]